MTQHALLSASAAHRWLHCTAAPRLEAEFPDTTSEYAREGTLAHAIAELKVRKYAVEPMSQSTFTKAYNKLKKDELYQSEMDGYTNDYLDYVKTVMLQYDVRPHVVLEKRVDFSAYVPEGFGTADCIIMAGDVLHIIDFKYGKGVPVDAVGNPQMRLYALGALAAYGMLYTFTSVVMHIVQPRINNYSTDTMPVPTLINWGKTYVKPKAEAAFNGKGEFEPGDGCRFCRAKMQCKARSEHYASYSDTAREQRDVRLMTMDDLGWYLTVSKDLKAWAEDLHEYALSCCLSGRHVPGWKAVEGRGSRTFTDLDAAFNELMDHGIDKTVLYNYVPLTLAQAEKVVGKTEFNKILSDYIVKNPGKPTLAPESDKREAITNATKAKDVFTKLED